MHLSLIYLVNLQEFEQDHHTQYVLRPYWEKDNEEVKSFGWTATEKAKYVKIDQIKVSPIVPPSAIPSRTFTMQQLI